jgi:hypothetical protein
MSALSVSRALLPRNIFSHSMQYTRSSLCHSRFCLAVTWIALPNITETNRLMMIKAIVAVCHGNRMKLVKTHFFFESEAGGEVETMLWSARKKKHCRIPHCENAQGRIKIEILPNYESLKSETGGMYCIWRTVGVQDLSWARDFLLHTVLTISRVSYPRGTSGLIPGNNVARDWT